MGSIQYIKNVMDVMDVLDVMDVMDVSNAYILAKNEDNATKLSGYDPWGRGKYSFCVRPHLGWKDIKGTSWKCGRIF